MWALYVRFSSKIIPRNLHCFSYLIRFPIIGYLPLGYLSNYFQGVVRDISRYYPRYIKVLSIMDILIHLPNYFFLSFAQLYQSFAQLFQGFAQLFILNVLPNYIRDLHNYFFSVFCPIILRTYPIISRICPII